MLRALRGNEMAGCTNGCPGCPDGYGCVIKNCVTRNGVPTCAHCAAFPCEEIVPEDWPGREYEPVWVASPTARHGHLTALRATLGDADVVEPKALVEGRARVVPMPSRMVLSRKACEVIHCYLSAVAMARPATSYARQYRIRQAKHHLVSYLWQFGRGGELRMSPHPHMWMEKHEWKKREQDIPDPHWAMDIARCHMPGVQAGVLLKKTTSPKNWEVALRMDGSQDGLDTLRALQAYTRALCDTYGEPVWAGNARYKGEAYTRFAAADMTVLSR